MSLPDAPASPDTRASVAASIRRALLLGLAVWQVVVVLAVVVVETRVPTLPLVLAHVGVVALVALTLRHPAWFGPTIAACYVLWFVDYRAASDLDDVVTLAACWFGNVLYGVSALAMRGWGRVVVPIGGAAAVAVGLDLTDSLWDLEVTSAYVVTAIAICAAGVLALPALWRIADEVDDSAASLEGRRTEAIVAERAGREAAEDARIVHDTVINTLGAVANGGRGTADEAAVAARCDRDLRVVTTLLEGRRAELEGGLASLGADVDGLSVRREGLGLPQLADLESALDPRALHAVTAAAREAVLNAAKHAGVDEVHLCIDRTTDLLVVTIRDAGSGDVSDGEPGLGLQESVRARMADVGGRVDLVSAPGTGTTVRLECPLAATDPERVDVRRPVEVVAGALLRRAAWLWTVGVVAVGVVIEAVNRPGELTATYGMLLVVTVGAATTWVSLRRTDHLALPVEAVLVVGTSVGFVLAMAGIGFGTVGVLYYQAIGITPLTTLLLVVGSRTAHRLALAGLLATAAVLVVVLVGEDASRAAIVVVGVAPAVGIAVGWAAFAALVQQLVAQSEHNRGLAFAARVQGEAQRQVAQARRRWSTAGLERSAVLLERIVGDPRLVREESVRAACSDEERHLRQLLLLSASTPRMSPWFAQALQRARERRVSLSVRSGDADAPDLPTAERLGELVLVAVDAVPVGTSVTVGFYPTSTGCRLVLVVPGGHARRVVDAVRDVDVLSLDLTRLPDVDVVEVSARALVP